MHSIYLYRKLESFFGGSAWKAPWSDPREALLIELRLQPHSLGAEREKGSIDPCIVECRHLHTYDALSMSLVLALILLTGFLLAAMTFDEDARDE